MESTLVNKVVNSGLLTIDLEKFYPEGDFIYFDIKDYLFQGLILKEKDLEIEMKAKLKEMILPIRHSSRKPRPQPLLAFPDLDPSKCS